MFELCIAHSRFVVATKTPQEAAPALGRGALCADSMGLGKTLTMLALVLATKLDIPVDHSNATLIGTRINDLHEQMLTCFGTCSCPTFRDVQLGEANRRPLPAWLPHVLRVLREVSRHVSQ